MLTLMARPTARAGLALTLVLASCSGSDESSAGAGGSAGGSAGASGGAGDGAGGVGGSGGSVAGSGGSAGSCVPSTPSVARVGTTFEVPVLAATGPKRNPDIAYDPVHDVYLVVTGASAISGTFLDPDGQSLAPPFAIPDTDAYTQTPRVTYGAAGFLVAWHDARADPNKPELRARVVRWSGSAPDLGAPDFSVSGGAQSYQEMGAALAYSETSKLFLVVWQSEPGDDLHARRVEASGALVGDEIVLTSDADWQSGAAAAWSLASDEFLVTYAHADAQGAAVRAQRVRASDGSLIGTAIELGTGAGTWTTQVAYLPCEDRFVAGWIASGAVGLGLSASGEPDGAPFSFPSGYGYPDGFAFSYQPMTDTFVAVMHGPSDEDFATAFVASGQQSAVLQATDDPGSDGHFNPRIAASSLGKEWLMVTSLGFSSVVAQRLGP
jgi:hypothetical protein